MSKSIDMFVYQEGGPTAVIDGSIAGILKARDDLKKQENIYLNVNGSMNGLEGFLYANVSGNLVSFANSSYSEFLHTGPGSGLGTTRFGPKEKYFEEALVYIENVLNILKNPKLAGIGGNDTSNVLKRLLKKYPHLNGGHGVKTIDDDLLETIISPGALSTLLFNAIAIINVYQDFGSYSLKGNVMKANGEIIEAQYLTCPILIYQIMGRESGRQTQGTGIAKVDESGQIDPDKPPHIIISKETPFHKNVFYNRLEDVLRKHGKAVIAVQEDITDGDTGKSLVKLYKERQNQRMIELQNIVNNIDKYGNKEIKQYSKNLKDLLEIMGQLPEEDASGNVQHGRANSFSTGQHLAQLVTKNFKVDTFYGKIKEAVAIPQHLQRAAYEVVKRDQEFAIKVGYRLATELAHGKSGFSVILKKGKNGFETDTTPIENIAGKGVQVNQKFIMPNYGGPTQEFVNHYLDMMGGAGVIPHYAVPTMTPLKPITSIKPFAVNPRLK